MGAVVREIVGFHRHTNTLRERLGAGVIGFGQEHQKLLASIPGDDIAQPNGIEQQSRHIAQYIVADEVAICIVDALEVIEIDHQQRECGVVAQRPFHLCRNPIRQGTTIEELRQRISLRELLKSRIVGHRALDHLRTLNDRNGGGDHRLGKLQIRLSESLLIPRPTHQEHAVLATFN